MDHSNTRPALVSCRCTNSVKLIMDFPSLHKIYWMYILYHFHFADIHAKWKTAQIYSIFGFWGLAALAKS